MDVTPPPPDRLDTLTAALVRHVRECFADYAEVDLADPGRAVSTPARDVTVPRVPVDVRDARTGGAAPEERRVLVLCRCTEDTGTRAPDGHLAATDGACDVVQVRRASEIAGAVAESTAGDLPLLVDVRLGAADAEALLGSRAGPA